MAPNTNSSTGGLTRLLTVIGIVIGVLTPIIYVLERNLESLYVFGIDELHEVAKRGIAHGGNDTAKIVEFIVDELKVSHPKYVNPRWNVPEEWMFNNAGGAMGGMYLIHASK